MAETPTILYFGNDWSGENRTSSHHVARWLAARYRVIYVECPGLRAPKGTGRDLRKLAAKLRLALAGPRPQPEGLSVQTLLQIPLHRFDLVRRANRALIRMSLKLLLRRLGVRAPVTWFVVPHLAGVLTACLSAILYKVVDVIVGLRANVETEREGLDITEHTERAYNM